MAFVKVLEWDKIWALYEAGLLWRRDGREGASAQQPRYKSYTADKPPPDRAQGYRTDYAGSAYGYMTED